MANHIEAILTGATTCLLPPKKLESLAQTYASCLICNLDQPNMDKEETDAVPDYATIDLKSVVHQEARTVGVEGLLLGIAKQLKLPELHFSPKTGFSSSQQHHRKSHISGRGLG